MEAMERASLWATNAYFDAETRSAAAEAMKDENQLLRLFGTELRFGTGGLRGILGAGTTRLNRYTGHGKLATCRSQSDSHPPLEAGTAGGGAA